MKKSVLCLGDPVFDAFAFVDDQLLIDNNIEKGSAPVKDPAEVKRITDSLTLAAANCGGSAANVAKGIGFLGGKVALLGQYGDDERGGQVRDSFISYGVEDRCLMKVGGTTTQIFILVTPDAQRTMLAIFGTSHALDCSKVNYSVIDEYDYLLLEGYQFGSPNLIQNAYNCLNRAEEKGVGVILCLSNIFCVNSYYEHIKHFSDKAKIIAGNDEEFLKLFSIDKVEDLLSYLETLCTNSPDSKYVGLIVTLGKYGAWVFWKGQKIFVGAPDVEKPTDTSGAGDYFVAGLLYGFFHGYSLETTTKLAQILAGDVISHVGTLLSDNIKDEIKKILG
ncbi:sugar kinase [Candidatus Mycoplasma haematobovis]|uniref:Sugar kinase n=1 Tax=Candidatus Mycoplasma haematobovis TaxID=432608 RepID=A0A1A9QDL9_9MOLU|nr:adenosine kinase [Candidatus Mycoplasma haematobovis]OAL10348.1 sugar kinase [Candidatus Mycoplasma haematobovis]